MGDWHFQFNIDADKENRIVYGKIFGVWRKETAEDYLEAFKVEAAEITAKPWAKLINLKNWRMGTADVDVAIGEHMKWCSDNNMEIQIYVISDTARYAQLKKMLKQSRTKNVTTTFRTMVEAAKFLKEKGYNVTKTFVD